MRTRRLVAVTQVHITCEIGKVLQHWRRSCQIISTEPKCASLSLLWLGLGPQTHRLQQGIHLNSHLINCLIRPALGKLCSWFSLSLWCLMPFVAAQNFLRGWAFLVTVAGSRWRSLLLGFSSLFWDNWPWCHREAPPQVTPLALQPVPQLEPEPNARLFNLEEQYEGHWGS